MSYYGLSGEAEYQAAFAAGKDSSAAFTSRCTSYGFTSAKNGTSWDDLCIAHEESNKLGPVYNPSSVVVSKSFGMLGDHPMISLGVGAGAGAMLGGLLGGRTGLAVGLMLGAGAGWANSRLMRIV